MPMSRATRATAHPRSRGENRSPSSAWRALTGSSPLTRGKRNQRLRLAIYDGLIPAHAGKTNCVTGRHKLAWAHPRSRGENIAAVPSKPSAKGSSPLTRGKLADQALTLDGLGLIPAHAGKTETADGIEIEARAHPRSRGENASLFRG